MRIMIDTNVIISAILFPSSLPSTLIKSISTKHEIVLCTQIVDELYRIFKRKFEEKTSSLEAFLTELNYDLVYTPHNIEKEKFPFIRDENDFPILVSAIIDSVDVIITGDKDFLEVEIEFPQIMTAREFLEQDSEEK